LKRHGVDSLWILNEESRVQAEKLSLSSVVFLGNPFERDLRGYLDDAGFAVIDSYYPKVEFYSAISERLRVVAIDDLADRGVESGSSVLVNYGIGASASLYHNPSAHYLLGPRYTLLREEYWDTEACRGDYVLFVPGASDVMDAAEQLLEMWREDWPQLVIALGALVPEGRRRRAAGAAEGLRNVTVKVAPENFVGLMAGAGAVICSASVTAYEALAMQKKTAVFSVAQNQEGLGEILEKIGAAYNLGEWKDVSRGKISRALAFVPGAVVLNNLINKTGSLICAKELLSFFM
jgi:spore coat polysaccharide biosynthesis predicted glycosyltransferase SpsG